MTIKLAKFLSDKKRDIGSISFNDLQKLFEENPVGIEILYENLKRISSDGQRPKH